MIPFYAKKNSGPLRMMCKKFQQERKTFLSFFKTAVSMCPRQSVQKEYCLCYFNFRPIKSKVRPFDLAPRLAVFPEDDALYVMLPQIVADALECPRDIDFFNRANIFNRAAKPRNPCNYWISLENTKPGDFSPGLCNWLGYLNLVIQNHCNYNGFSVLILRFP